MAGYHAERLGYLVQQWKCGAPNIDIQPTKKRGCSSDWGDQQSQKFAEGDSLFVHVVN